MVESPPLSYSFLVKGGMENNGIDEVGKCVEGWGAAFCWEIPDCPPRRPCSTSPSPESCQSRAGLPACRPDDGLKE